MMKIVNKQGLTEEEFLAQYQPQDYERPSVAVDMMILRMDSSLEKLQLLLIQREDHPYINCYALAGGFVKITESAYEAASRKLSEETGLANIYLEQLYTMSQPDRDPRMRVIDIAYIALLPVDFEGENTQGIWVDVEFGEKRLTFKNEEHHICIEYALEKRAFENGVVRTTNYIPELISEQALAFDHAQIILEGLMRLRNKLEYSDVAFNLVPDKFTLPDLQKVYEIILGKKLYKTNFKDKVKDKIIPLEEKGPSVSGKKKSNLYQYGG